MRERDEEKNLNKLAVFQVLNPLIHENVKKGGMICELLSLNREVPYGGEKERESMVRSDRVVRVHH